MSTSPPLAYGKLITCRVCKAVCAEQPDDPCPGICVTCLSRWMHKEFPNGEVPHTTDPKQLSRIRRILRQMGWRPDAIPAALRPNVIDGESHVIH